ncbi:MAG: hypothetical protein U1E65_17260 [Myxococcota bacterium]
MHDLKDVGGTRGGLLPFLLGLAAVGGGGYLFLDRVTVYGGFWSFAGSGGSSFGLLLIPVMVGIALLFYNGKSAFGWVLFVGGLAAILLGIITNLQVHFQQTSLVGTLIILGLIAGGVGMIIRSLYPVGRD